MKIEKGILEGREGYLIPYNHFCTKIKVPDNFFLDFIIYLGNDAFNFDLKPYSLIIKKKKNLFRSKHDKTFQEYGAHIHAYQWEHGSRKQCTDSRDTCILTCGCIDTSQAC